jgi:hypothetical protein
MALRGQASPYEPSPGADVTAGPSPVLAQYECAMAAAKRGKASRAMLTHEWRQWVTQSTVVTSVPSGLTSSGTEGGGGHGRR